MCGAEIVVLALQIDMARTVPGVTPRHAFDGSSNTLGFSEVKAFQAILKRGGSPTSTPPSNPSQLASICGSNLEVDNGHTEWIEGRVHQDGFTTTFTPNAKVPYVSGSVTYDVDYTSDKEGDTPTGITYAAVTSRSYHTGIVNSLMMDGAVRTISENLDYQLWRKLGTRAGGEVVGEY